ncbi:MAG TPA: hypothetical protein VJY39_08990 [Acidisphaera sp.]|nr:hypothetical protein [Acidisphaera sp.]
MDFLRENFARVHAKLDRIGEDVRNLQVRMPNLEGGIGHLTIGQAELNSRMDGFERRLDRIERRLDLTDATVPG